MCTMEMLATKTYEQPMRSQVKELTEQGYREVIRGKKDRSWKWKARWLRRPKKNVERTFSGAR